MIHPLALVDPAARLASSVSVGPWSIVGPGVEVGDDTEIRSHVVLRGPTVIGQRNTIFQFASVGEEPADRKYRREPTTLQVGDDNVIREGVTIHRGTVQGGGQTSIGSRNLVMAYAHIAHDVVVGDDCILANNATLAGHVRVASHATLGGFALVHQYCGIGSYSFCGMGAVVLADVPAFVKVAGNPARALGINVEGLRRSGAAAERIGALQRCFALLYDEKLPYQERIKAIEAMREDNVQVLLESLQGMTRGLVRRH